MFLFSFTWLQETLASSSFSIQKVTPKVSKKFPKVTIEKSLFITAFQQPIPLIKLCEVGRNRPGQQLMAVWGLVLPPQTGFSPDDRKKKHIKIVFIFLDLAQSVRLMDRKGLAKK